MAKKRIQAAYSAQSTRYGRSDMYNSMLSSRDIKTSISLSSDVAKLLETAAEKFAISARGYFKLIKVARTIADLDDAPAITARHMAEAIQYRHGT